MNQETEDSKSLAKQQGPLSGGVSVQFGETPLLNMGDLRVLSKQVLLPEAILLGGGLCSMPRSSELRSCLGYLV